MLVLGGVSLTTAPAALAAGCTITDGPSLQAAVDGGGTVTLCQNITYTSPDSPGLTIPAGKTVTLDLAGFTLDLTGAARWAGIQTVDATLIINGPGTLKATGGDGIPDSSGGGSGIGGSDSGSLCDGGTLTINAVTTVEATGGLGNVDHGGGSGIGGCGAHNGGGAGGTVTINGSTVTATGGVGGGLGGGVGGGGLG
ncbi:hypothetical protein GTY80_19700, partial [Amycolatopsis sp. SID8362]|nr:hypothetical protein [Amycolatopsis sp. SID8362]NED42167.1 hypothetical protein [Amycolatopsis sp. SID8362]